jgi:hypothetical protein
VEKLTGRRFVPRDLDNSQEAGVLAARLVDAGQLSITEARALGALVQQSDPTRPIIEIGTLFGWSTLIICLFKDPGQKLITVDNYSWNPLGLTPDEHFRITSERLAVAKAELNVDQVKVGKDEFYESYAGARPALFFCDADHTYEATKADLVWARSVDTDIICGDDYSPSAFPGVVQAVADLGGPSQVTDELFVLAPPG